jgi:hypothetical protein
MIKNYKAEHLFPDDAPSEDIPRNTSDGNFRKNLGALFSILDEN